MNAPVIIGLGSSDTRALNWLRRALAALKLEPGIRILRVSAIYQSDAMLPEGAPASWKVPYLNLAVACEIAGSNETALTPGGPLALLAQLKGLEKKLGRQERERWAPREIDLDILAWGNLKLESTRLNIPHPGLLKRPFALLPLAEVAPDWLREQPEYQRVFESWKDRPLAEVPFRTCKSRERLTELVAILNLTPDSFSDGGVFYSGAELSPEAIVRAARAAMDCGATVLDLGAESTRPGAQEISSALEWHRLEVGLRAVKSLPALSTVRISVDSHRPETVARALDTGIVNWINDVSGFASPSMKRLARAADSSVEFVAMHSLGVPPQRSQTLPRGQDPIEAILHWGHQLLAEFAELGIGPERVILDPGLGFGKTPEQNFHILREAGRLHELKTRLLIGHSRKSFHPNTETGILSAHLAAQRIEYLRVHDIAAQAQALSARPPWPSAALAAFDPLSPTRD